MGYHAPTTVTVTPFNGNARYNAPGGPTPVAIDGTPQSGGNASVVAGGTLSWTQTVNAGDRLVVMLASSCSSGVTTIAGVTANGVAMTLRQSALSGAGTTAREVDIYTMDNPPTGSVTIVATMVASGVSYSVDYTSAAVKNSTATYATPAPAVTASGTALSVSTTTTALGLILAVAAIRSTTIMTINGAQVAFQNVITGSNMNGCQTQQPGGSAKVSSANWSVADNGALATIGIT